MNVIRFLFRSLWLAVLGIGVPLALLLAAWLPFNMGFSDAPARPSVAELSPAPAQLPDVRNAAFAVMGLMAEAGREPHATGRALWAAQAAQAALDARQRPAAEAASQAKREALLGKTLKAPEGAPLFCKSGGESCTEEWFAQTEALARQRQAFGLIGERCDKVFGAPFEFEEPLLPSLAPDTPIMNFVPLIHCSRWFRTGAVLALARGQRDKALEQVRHAERLQRAVWEGSRTLIGYMVATRMARWTYDLMAAMALREPTLAEAMAPWLAGPLDTQVGARRWMRAEAGLQRAIVDHIARDGADMPGIAGLPEFAGVPWGGGPLGEAMAGLARRGIGLQPHRTRQHIEEAWQREIGKLQYAWPAVLAGAGVEQRARDSRTVWSHLRWRNTFGEFLVDATAGGAHRPYFARHADHELHREATALVLALQRQRTPAAGRAEAARRSTASDMLKERMSWDAAGRTLNVRTWQAETLGAGFNERRDAISFTWP